MPIEQHVADAETKPIIMVTIDGVMWQDVFGPRSHELVPNTWAAAEARGTALGVPGYGEAISASGPNFVSLPGYIELFEGRTHTGCTTNFCDGATAPTLADEIKAQHVDDPSSVAIITSWERIEAAATVNSSDIVVSAGSVNAQGLPDIITSFPATRAAYCSGLGTSAWPGHGDYRPDRFTGRLALTYLEAHRPAFLFVGLGDTDEYAHRGDRRGYEDALHRADQFVGQVLTKLRLMGSWGERTTIIITADHGRADNFRGHGAAEPESARSWLFALGSLVSLGTYASAPIPRHLADIAPTVRSLVGLPANPLSDGTVMSELLHR